MQKSSILFLKLVLCLIAIGALAGMIIFPQKEGRATDLDLISIYSDPFIIYMYIASIPFFIALHQAFQFLRLVEKHKTLTQESVSILKNIKFCVLAFMTFITVALSYIFIMSKTTNDDGAGAMAVGIVIIVVSSMVVAIADVFHKILRDIHQQS